MPLKEGYTFNGKRVEKTDSRNKQVKSTHNKSSGKSKTKSSGKGMSY